MAADQKTGKIEEPNLHVSNLGYINLDGLDRVKNKNVQMSNYGEQCQRVFFLRAKLYGYTRCQESYQSHHIQHNLSFPFQHIYLIIKILQFKCIKHISKMNKTKL